MFCCVTFGENGVCSVVHCIPIVIGKVSTHEGLDEIPVRNKMFHGERIQVCFTDALMTSVK